MRTPDLKALPREKARGEAERLGPKILVNRQ